MDRDYFREGCASMASKITADDSGVRGDTSSSSSSKVYFYSSREFREEFEGKKIKAIGRRSLTLMRADSMLNPLRTA